MKLNKVIISGGGTGGHIFPALAIANEVKARFPEADILFVGAEGKMEMEKVPAAGYKIVGLPIRGLSRKLSLELLTFPLKVMKSLSMAKKLIKDFKPDVVVGVGGYASAPTLKAAQKLGVPTLIQEQNSFAGLTNKLLGKKVQKVCTAFPNMEAYFPKDKIVLTGNPVRKQVVEIQGKRAEALSYFNLSQDKKTLLVIGGSLGARTINNAIRTNIDAILAKGYQVIWQCGKFYEDEFTSWLKAHPKEGVYLSAFIMDMDLAYAASDVVVSRAGAMSVSEICLVAKPAIFIPSPNVAEDHQTKNAKSLVDRGAGVLLPDATASEGLMSELDRLGNEATYMSIEENLRKAALVDADTKIVDELLKIK